MKTSSWWLKAALMLALTTPVWLSVPAAAGTKAQIKIEQAKVAYSDKDYKQAKSLLAEALAEEPNNGEALQYAGLAEMADGNPQGAVGYLERASQAMPNDPGVWEDLAWANLASQKFDAALASTDKALALSPERPRANLLKGQALIGLKRNEEALAPLAKVNDSTYAQAAQFYSGVAMLALGRTDDSKPFFKKAQELGPNTALGKKAGEYLGGLSGGEGGPAKAKAYNARVRLMYQYDTNIVTVNDNEYLPNYIGEKEDGRVVLDADLAWHFVNQGNARATARYIGYASWHFQEDEMNLQYHLAELSGFYAAKAGAANLKFGAAVNYGYAGLDNETYSTALAGIPYIEIAWSKTMMTGIDVSWMQEDFNDEYELMGSPEIINARDNDRIHVTLRQHFSFAEGKVGVVAAYRWGQVNADGDNYNRQDNGGFLGLNLGLPAKSRLSALVRYDDRLYPDNNFDRHDRLTIANVSYEIPVWQMVHFYTSVVYTNVDSNMTVLEYERWIYGAGLVVDL